MSKELDGRIALTLGWTGLKKNVLWLEADMLGYPPGKELSSVPRWSSSLDLMWELVSGLTEDEYGDFVCILDDEVIGNKMGLADYDGEIRYEVLRTLMEATAEQKAEAWLKVREGK